VVKLRFTEYLSNNNLLNSFKSAYFKHHSTSNALLYVHDHIIKAMSHQQVTCLTHLDLSAAFDTIERLSAWFGITSTSLSGVKSYLLNRSFYVSTDRGFSIICLPTSLWCASRLCSWSFSLNILHQSF
jgi:hypothetical protein